MSLLLLYRPRQDAGPPAPVVTPRRTLLGVGMTLAAFLLGGLHG